MERCLRPPLRCAPRVSTCRAWLAHQPSSTPSCTAFDTAGPHLRSKLQLAGSKRKSAAGTLGDSCGVADSCGASKSVAVVPGAASVLASRPAASQNTDTPRPPSQSTGGHPCGVDNSCGAQQQQEAGAHAVRGTACCAADAGNPRRRLRRDCAARCRSYRCKLSRRPLVPKSLFIWATPRCGRRCHG